MEHSRVRLSCYGYEEQLEGYPLAPRGGKGFNERRSRPRVKIDRTFRHAGLFSSALIPYRMPTRLHSASPCLVCMILRRPDVQGNYSPCCSWHGGIDEKCSTSHSACFRTHVCICIRAYRVRNECFERASFMLLSKVGRNIADPLALRVSGQMWNTRNQALANDVIAANNQRYNVET